MFVNLSNHPSGTWSITQRDAALELSAGGPIVDLPFPHVDPAAPAATVVADARECAQLVLAHFSQESLHKGTAVAMIQGEPTFVFALLLILIPTGVRCFAATTDRIVTATRDEGDVVRKTSEFRFIQFREYTPGSPF